MRFLRGFFALLMAAAGIGKLLDMPGFYAVVASYHSLPGFLIPPAAWALALSELGLAAWLTSGRRLPMAAVGVVLIHLMYLAWLLMGLVRGLDVPNCGCFGVYLARPLTWYSPLEDAGLLLLALILWRQTARVGA